MTQEVGLAAVCEEIGQAFARNDMPRIQQLLSPALNQFSDIAQLWFFAGNYFFKTGDVAIAAVSFERALQLDGNPLPLANLAAALRRLNRHEDGIAVGERLVELCPNYEPGLINLGCMYVNEGMPEDGIGYLERAVAIGNTRGEMEHGAEWNLALLYLEAGRFKEGFELYRRGLGKERQQRVYGFTQEVADNYAQLLGVKAVQAMPEPEWLKPEHGGKGKTLVVYGEQGIGDELMIGSLLADAAKEFDEVIFECHPRLEQIHRSAHPNIRIYPTRKDSHIVWPLNDLVGAIDYKAPIFDLAARYRPDLQSFLTAYAGRERPTYSAFDSDGLREIDEYRSFLSAVADGRPIIALGTRGGVPTTARQYRTLRQHDVDRLFSETNALFVSVDYDDMSDFALYIHEKYGPERYIWNPSIVQHWDYVHTAALIAACDLTITVCQSAFHMSAGMGQPTLGLVPKRCAWRYAPVENLPQMSYWYPARNVKLLRQDDTETWEAPISAAIEEIKKVQR